VRIPSGDLQKLIQHTAFAASTEESRPILNGVLWELRADHMRMVATNGHRLAKMEVGVSGGQKADLIIPPKALDQIRRLFAAEEELEVAQGENHLGFRSPFTSVFTRLIEGPYPGYEQVIPKDNDKYAILDKAAFTSALKRMSVVASDQTHRIRLSFNAGMLKFSVSTPDLGEAQDELPIRYEGRPARHRLQRGVPARDPAPDADGGGAHDLPRPGTCVDHRARGLDGSGEVPLSSHAAASGRLSRVVGPDQGAEIAMRVCCVSSWERRRPRIVIRRVLSPVPSTTAPPASGTNSVATPSPSAAISIGSPNWRPAPRSVRRECRSIRMTSSPARRVAPITR
jgi:hypothetical protein